jgi:hypothetical protein
MTIEKFAAEYNNLLSTNGNVPQISMSEPVKPLPKLEKKDDHRVKCWAKDQLMAAIQAMDLEKGQTDGDSSSTKVKAKPGRPPKKSSGEDAHSQFYLENSDGTPISKAALLALSQKARAVWETLHTNKLAPVSWGRISSVAWDFYARTMLNQPGLEFLRLCDDGQWKLKEWSQRNYSGWAGNRGIRPRRVGKNKNKNKQESDAETDNEDLSDPTLIRMDPDDSAAISDVDENNQHKSEESNGGELVRGQGETPSPSVGHVSILCAAAD